MLRVRGAKDGCYMSFGGLLFKHGLHQVVSRYGTLRQGLVKFPSLVPVTRTRLRDHVQVVQTLGPRRDSPIHDAM